MKRLVVSFLFLCKGLTIAATAQTSQTQNRPSTIVTFGTSLTARGGWQVPLAEKLSSCLGWPVSVKMVAKSGAPSSWGLTHVEDVIRLKPDVVLVEFYANDAALNRFTLVSTSRETISAILTALRHGLPDVRVIMQIMNPVSGPAGLVRPYFNRYIDAHAQQARANGVDIIDHRKRWASLSSTDLAKAIPDGVHPTPDAAASIMVAPLAEKIGGAGCGS